MPLDASLEPGVSLLVTIDRLDPDGAGVAEVPSSAAFFRLHVAGALPGERVRATVTHVSPHLLPQGRDAWADLEDIVSSSPERVTPPCPAHLLAVPGHFVKALKVAAQVRPAELVPFQVQVSFKLPVLRVPPNITTSPRAASQTIPWA